MAGGRAVNFDHITGLREIIRDLEDLGIEVADLKEVMGAIASTAAEVMKPFIPELSGKLRASARGNKAKGKAVVTVGKASIKYASAINWGWGPLHGNYKHGHYAKNMRGGFIGANFTGRTDEVMEGRATEMFIDGLNDLLKRKGLSQ